MVQSLFSDGHIRYSARADDGGKGLRFLGVHEEIIPGSLGAMGWILGDTGMRMILAREVPDLISASLRGFLRRLFERTGTDPAEALARGVFAVHPGGPRIIDKVASLLELRPAQVAASRAVLKAYGNMSSATLPHVWADMLNDAARSLRYAHHQPGLRARPDGIRRDAAQGLIPCGAWPRFRS